MRLIDADILIQDTIQEYARSKQYRDAVIRMVNKAPTVEPKRGEWKFVGSSIEMMWECPFCGEHTFGFEEHLPNYCSNCGADIRKGVDV